MSRPDEIMAQHLLNGGKMLAESCPICHNPLFEYNGQRQCVICQETEGTENGQKDAQRDAQEEAQKSRLESLIHQHSSEKYDIYGDDTVQQAAYNALLHALLRIVEEDDVRAIAELSTSCAILTKVYLKLIDL